ncbi:MAG: aminoglycoside phosphotransferase family protein [Deltaproteobacteria bacterium]|nr:aminoglycoside phosphotransferase family protein [Deltaproteobacteria bacterium]
MSIPSTVLARWARFAHATPAPFGTGLINKTFLVDSGAERAVFQRLHPVFAGSVNDDIDAVTSHLVHKGMVTPRVLRTDDGALFVDDPESGRPWRALSFVDGVSFDRIDAPPTPATERAHAAAALVARFHAALVDLDWQYRHVRAGVHDTDQHLFALDDALERHGAHRLWADASALGAQILEAGAALPALTALPLCNCHGDLKISNVLFARDDARALCLVDLDTLGTMRWPFEMGDALRSWCNPRGEDVDDADVDVSIFAATVEGYAAGGGRPSALEAQHLVDGLHTICVELAARFCADALNESYFGWDERRFPGRGEHNLLRARGQWALARAVARRRQELDALVRRSLG